MKQMENYLVNLTGNIYGNNPPCNFPFRKTFLTRAQRSTSYTIPAFPSTVHGRNRKIRSRCIRISGESPFDFARDVDDDVPRFPRITATRFLRNKATADSPRARARVCDNRILVSLDEGYKCALSRCGAIETLRPRNRRYGTRRRSRGAS